jgi:shikimate dehydrogenase/3-dehydroquinate dehydratase type I
MTDPRPRLVVTLSARTLEEASQQVEVARAAGGDCAEVRFDLWAPEEQRRIAGLFPSPLPLLGTVRSRAEGGSGPDEAPERAPMLHALFDLPFTYVDLEADRDRLLEGPAMDRGRQVVRSAHLPAGTSMPALRARLADRPPPSGVVKVVLPARFARLVEDLLPIIEDLPDPRPILLVTGPAGPVWRTMAPRLRIPWIFCSLPRTDAGNRVEPAQLPVDEVARYLSVPRAPVFAVVGHPVAHSLSPRLHNTWMAEGGRTGVYVPLDLESPMEFRQAIEILPGRGAVGLNVTHPWKRLAYDCASFRSSDALATGAANCLRFADGTITAENTDLGAIARRLVELREAGHWDGAALTVLGGGGAARATLAAAERLGCRTHVLTRRPSVAEELSAEFDARPGPPSGPASLLVHATDVGRAGREGLELPYRPLLSPRTYLLDWVYAPDDRRLASLARSVGARYEDGLRLLVYQAAASFATWWGDPPPPGSVESAVKELACAA